VQQDDPLDRVVGARAEWDPGEMLTLGVHGVYLAPRFTDEADIEADRMYVDQGTGVRAANAGGSVELRVGPANVYLEGNGQSHDNYRPPGSENDVENESGYAALGEVSFDVTPLNLKAQGIYYRRWLMEGPLRGSAPNVAATQPISYNNLVTLEPTWVVNRSLGNAYGGKLTGDLYLRASKTQIVVAGNAIKSEGGLMPQGGWDDHGEVLSFYPNASVVQDVGDTGIRTSLEGGYRHELSTGGSDETGHLWNLRGNLLLPVVGPHSLEIVGEVRRHALALTEGGHPYWVVLTTLGYDRSGLFGVAVVYEYSDQTPGEEAIIGDWVLPLPLQHYLAVVASVQVPEPLDGLTARLVAGTQRGGHKCAGGVCRDYPDSVGATLEVVYRF
jgi:hypothetical protein